MLCPRSQRGCLNYARKEDIGEEIQKQKQTQVKSMQSIHAMLSMYSTANFHRKAYSSSVRVEQGGYLQSGRILRPSTTRAARSLGLSLERIARHTINTQRRRRDPEGGVFLEEIRRAEHDADGLGGHDGEVFCAREMRESELQVAHDIGVLDVFVAVGPVHDALVVWVVLLAC